MKSAKILGVTVRNDLKWNDHVHDITAKASRIYLLKQLNRAGVDPKSLMQFYCACIRSVLEYVCQACQPICRSFPKILVSSPTLQSSIQNCGRNVNGSLGFDMFI